MVKTILPAVWLIVLIVGLPIFAETVYTPSLPDIANSLQTSESMVEYTLTIYLAAFALGTLFWGKISDKIGRKPCVLMGLLIFILGCIGCYYSTSIQALLLSRFVQAFGGSIGSVIGQAICRDAFHGVELGKVYASMGSALAIFPAIGPIVGGYIAENFGWANIFLFLLFFALGLILVVGRYLPETHHVDNRKSISILQVARLLLRDQNVIGFGLIVAVCNGISFSYYAEAPFFLIKRLGLAPSTYGLSFLAVAACTLVGGMLAKKLHNTQVTQKIMVYGLRIILLASGLFSLAVLLCSSNTIVLSHTVMIIIAVAAQMGIMFGMCMATSSALAAALQEYKWCIGTASSLFGFFYYSLISIITLGMGLLHNGTLLPMPLYFFILSVFMLLVKHCIIKKQ